MSCCSRHAWARQHATCTIHCRVPFLESNSGHALEEDRFGATTKTKDGRVWRLRDERTSSQMAQILASTCPTPTSIPLHSICSTHRVCLIASALIGIQIPFEAEATSYAEAMLHLHMLRWQRRGISTTVRLYHSSEARAAVVRGHRA